MKQTIIIQLSKLIHVHGRSTTFARNASPADRLVRTAPASVQPWPIGRPLKLDCEQIYYQEIDIVQYSYELI